MVPLANNLLRLALSNPKVNPSSLFHNSGYKAAKKADSGPVPSVVNKMDTMASCPSADLW
jgi:hypothetical protein